MAFHLKMDANGQQKDIFIQWKEKVLDLTLLVFSSSFCKFLAHRKIQVAQSQQKHLNYKYPRYFNSWFLQMWKQFSCLPRRAAQPPSPSRRGSAGCLGTPGLFASPSRIQAPALLPLFSFWEQIKTIQFSPDRWHSFKLWPHCPYVSCAMYGLFHRILLAVSWWHIVPLFCSLALS